MSADRSVLLVAEGLGCFAASWWARGHDAFVETADEERTIFSSQLLENPTLLKASAVSLLSVFLATTFGPLQRILDTTELNIQQWAISIVLSSLIIVVAEARKLMRRRSSAR